MPISVNRLNSSGGGGILHSKGLGVIEAGAGAITGNPGLIGMGAAQMTQGSPAGNAFSMYRQGQGIASNFGATPQSPQGGESNPNAFSPQDQMALGQYGYQTDPSVFDDQLSAMNRRMQAPRGY